MRQDGEFILWHQTLCSAGKTWLCAEAWNHQMMMMMMMSVLKSVNTHTVEKSQNMKLSDDDDDARLENSVSGGGARMRLEGGLHCIKQTIIYSSPPPPTLSLFLFLSNICR